MKILIVGDGKIGHTLAEQLIAEGHSVTIVERSDAVIQRGQDILDALFVKGSGVSVETLREADVMHADIVIAATFSDETNMLCCLTAKRLGAQYAIARIRDPEYLSSLPFLQKELSIDYAVNPERATAREISRMLRFPFTGHVETFARGRAEMMDFRAAAGDWVTGTPLRELYKKNRACPRVLFCAVERDRQAIIPKGDFIIKPDDIVYVASDVKTITGFFDSLGKNTLRVRRVMLMGGSRTAYYLAQMLTLTGFRVTLIEISPEKARSLSESLPGVNVIEGDGTDQELLISEGLDGADAFVALTDRDEENLMAGLYAARRGVGKVIVKNNRVNYSEIMASMGLDSIVSPKQVTANTILRTVRARGNAGGAAVERMYKIMDGMAEALEFIVKGDTKYTGIPLKDLRVREGALVAVIVREGQVRIPFGNDTIEAGDSVIVITRDQGIDDLGQVLAEADI